MFCAFFPSVPPIRNLFAFLPFLFLLHSKLYAQERFGRNAESNSIRYIAGDTAAINAQMTTANLLLEYAPIVQPRYTQPHYLKAGKLVTTRG